MKHYQKGSLGKGKKIPIETRQTRSKGPVKENPTKVKKSESKVEMPKKAEALQKSNEKQKVSKLQPKRELTEKSSISKVPIENKDSKDKKSSELYKELKSVSKKLVTKVIPSKNPSPQVVKSKNIEVIEKKK